MRKINRIIRPAAVLLLVSLLACGLSAGQKSDEMIQSASFRDIPGVTDDEIRAIEALNEKNPEFIFGAVLSTEAFMKHDGEVGGFVALFCEWLTQLFGIRFIPALYPLPELVKSLENAEVDFTFEKTFGAKQSGSYYMTDAVAERNIKMVRIKGSESFLKIAESRQFRLAFVNNSFAADAIISTFGYGSFEVVFVNDSEQAYRVLKNGNADAFFCAGGTEISFILYDDAVISDYFPLICESVSLSAQNSELEPIITVAQKALQNGAFTFLLDLYSQGQREYLRHTFFSRLTEDERAYIQNNPVIRYAAQYQNYPMSFYNAHEESWQGIAFKLLDEIEALARISFERAHGDEPIKLPDLLEMVESGQAAFITELIRAEASGGRFIWPKTTLSAEYFTLISRFDQRNFSFNEVKNLTVGVIGNTAEKEAFMRWFPNHGGIVEFDDIRDAVDALGRGELDLVMSSAGNLFALTNFQGFTGYKANIVFDNYIQKSTFGFNKDEVILCSIIDKALKIIDAEKISNDWKNRVFDYRSIMVEARRPWLIGTIVLILLVFILLFILLKNRRHAPLRQATARGGKVKADYPDKIQTNADWMLEIIDDMLDNLKIESGEIERRVPFDLNELIAGCRTLIMPKAVEKGIKLFFYVEPFTGGTPLGDPDRLRQVFLNLLSNAVKFTNTGTIKVHAKIKNAGEKIVTMHFIIKDSGIGMTSEQISGFMQGESEAARKDEGKGSGLALTKKIVELMGGKLSIESMLGVGAKFSFTLTFDTIDAADDAPQNNRGA